ncbi:MAG TPA: DUF559 domain-containing protein [Limnochordales bacterium]
MTPPRRPRSRWGIASAGGSFFEERLREVQARPAPSSRPAPDHTPHAMEDRLAATLRRAGLSDFRRRVRIGVYEVDFLFPRQRLVVELDGLVHLAADVRAKDRRKDEALRQMGYRVLHVENRELVAAPDVVVHRIRRALAGHAR